MKLIIDNLAADYTSVGKGPVVLVLHGWGDSSQSFQALGQLLAPKYRVILVDLPGFGATDIPQKAWTIEDYAKFVVKFCNKLSIQPEIIIGHSMGGRIAIKLVGEKLLSPQKLILLATAGIKQSDSVRNKTYKAAAKTGKFITNLPGLKKYQKSLRQKLYKSAGTTDYLQAGPMQETFVNVINEDLQATAKNILVPTLLVYGTDDAETPPEYGKVFHDIIKGSELMIIPDTGHFVQLDAIDQVANKIEEFVK